MPAVITRSLTDFSRTAGLPNYPEFNLQKPPWPFGGSVLYSTCY